MNRSPVDTPSESSQPEDEFRYDAFISYSHKDSAWMHNVLLARLEGEGLRTCIDTRDFDVGVPSLVNIENAVDQSRKTLLVLTPNWLASEWTAFEALLVQTEDPAGRRRRILPLMVQDCQDQLPKRLKMFTYLDLTDPTQLDSQMERLAAAVRAAPSQPSPSPPTGAAPAPRPGSPPEHLPESSELSGRLNGDFNLERGLAALGQRLAHADADTRLALSVLESRLLENMKAERLYGSTETVRAERARIVAELNRLALDHVGQSFNELCRGTRG